MVDQFEARSTKSRQVADNGTKLISTKEGIIASVTVFKCA